MDEQAEISTTEQAKLVAYQWAVQNHADPVKMQAYGESIFSSNGPMPLHAFFLSLNHFHHLTSRSARKLHSWGTLSLNIYSQWTLETVKHLAVWNIGGIAACSALIASPRGQWRDALLAWDILVFLAGLLCAVATFWMVAQANKTDARELLSRARAFEAAATWEKYIHAHKDGIRTGKPFAKWARRLGVSSAVAAVLGSSLIACALLCN